MQVRRAFDGALLMEHVALDLLIPAAACAQDGAPTATARVASSSVASNARYGASSSANRAVADDQSNQVLEAKRASLERRRKQLRQESEKMRAALARLKELDPSTLGRCD
jgi:uncharacterized caspase-like protein